MVSSNQIWQGAEGTIGSSCVDCDGLVRLGPDGFYVVSYVVVLRFALNTE